MYHDLVKMLFNNLENSLTFTAWIFPCSALWWKIRTTNGRKASETRNFMSWGVFLFFFGILVSEKSIYRILFHVFLIYKPWSVCKLFRTWSLELCLKSKCMCSYGYLLSIVIVNKFIFLCFRWKSGFIEIPVLDLVSAVGQTLRHGLRWVLVSSWFLVVFTIQDVGFLLKQCFKLQDCACIRFDYQADVLQLQLSFWYKITKLCISRVYTWCQWIPMDHPSIHYVLGITF